MLVRCALLSALLLTSGAAATQSTGRSAQKQSPQTMAPPTLVPPSQPRPPAPFETLQWLYGSGEGAATSIQAYNGFRNYVLATANARPRDSVVLAEGSTLENPAFIPCGERPLAVVLDVDETAIQNIGYQYDRDRRWLGYEDSSWDRWERTGIDKILPMPGAVDAIRAIRAAGVTVIYNSNRLSANSASSERALNEAGLGPAEHRRTLWLMNDAGTGSNKDPRRALISETYCVIAMAGDQLGDFSEIFRVSFARRRPAATSAPFARLWGNGWFMLSNPVYGPSMAGSRDEVFPPEVRWSDPGP